MSNEGECAKLLKLLFVHNYYRSSSPSGEDGAARSERMLLEENGIEVVPYEKWNDDINDSALTGRIRVGLDYAWSRRTYDELLDLLKRVHPTVAHFHSIHPQISPSAYAACQKMGVPVVQTLHNYRYICPGALLQRKGQPCEACLGHLPFNALMHRCYRESFLATGSVVWMIVFNRLRRTLTRMVDSYIALTEFAKSRFVAGGLPGERITIKPNFLPKPMELRGGQRDYGLFAGRISEEKGIKTLLSAWRSVEGVALKILGDGPLRKELECQARDEGMNVEFMGSVSKEEVLSAMQGALFALVPSECYEGFPMAVLEAYASATPVIASRIGSLAEIVLDGETGFHFEAGSVIDLLTKVNALLYNRNLALRMGQTASNIFKEKYTAETNFALLMEIYRRTTEDYNRRRKHNR